MKKAVGACRKASVVLAALLLISLVGAYIYYAGLKREFLHALSERASSYAGQSVEIGDISASPGGITLHNITVKNPEGFPAGELLHVERLSAIVDLSGLLKGRFHLRDVAVDSPRLSLRRDDKGRLNISRRLMQSFSKKSSLDYRIDKLMIHSGELSFNEEPQFRVDKLGLVLKNLSSKAGARSVLQGGLVYSGNAFDLSGWVNLKDDPKSFGLSLSSDDLVPPSFLVGEYGIRRNTSGSLRLSAEGDTAKGVTVQSLIILNKIVPPFVRGGIRKVTVSAGAFIDLKTDTVFLRDASVSADALLSADLKGVVGNFRKSPAIDGNIRIERLDLSAFDIPMGLHLSGMASSEGLNVKGPLGRVWPEVSGTVGLSGGSLVSGNFEMRGIRTELDFKANKRSSVKARISGELRRAGNVVIEAPIGVKASLTAAGSRTGPVDLRVGLSISPLITSLKDKVISLDGLSLGADGEISRTAFSGRVSIDSGDLLYGGTSLGPVTGGMEASYAQRALELKAVKIKSERFSLHAGRLGISGAPGGELNIAGKKIEASFLSGRAGISGMDLRASLKPDADPVSGNFALEASAVSLSGITSEAVSAEGRFGKHGFNVTVPAASLFKGKISLVADRGSGGGLFPIRLRLAAEHLDVASLSEAATGYVHLPVRLGGTIPEASFDGIIESAESMSGTASVTCKGLSVLQEKDKGSFLRDASVHLTGRFDQRDLDVEGEIREGNIAVKASGRVEDFASNMRKARIKASLPTAAVSDLRTTFWDIFPDSLLYAGLDGAISSDLTIDYDRSGSGIRGKVSFSRFSLTDENGRFFIGPVNGLLPFSYDSRAGRELPELPSFDAREFERLRKYYDSAPRKERDLSRITIGSFRYGFKVLEDMELLVAPGGAALSVERFSANIFGGRLMGSAAVNLAAGRPDYRAGFVLEGLSLSKLCDGIEPIRGYLSGMVDGVATIKGSGTRLSDVLGKADFWTYETKAEKRMISKEFLRKMGGTSLGSYLTDRPFDKGVMSLYLQKGFVIFRDLEISHKNFLGMTDLSVKVAPFNNRISVPDLLWSITEAAQRTNKE